MTGDVRLLDPEFNPIDDSSLADSETVSTPDCHHQFVTLFDRLCVAALTGYATTDIPSDKAAAFAATDAIAMLEERARRFGVQVTP